MNICVYVLRALAEWRVMMKVAMEFNIRRVNRYLSLFILLAFLLLLSGCNNYSQDNPKGLKEPNKEQNQTNITIHPLKKPTPAMPDTRTTLAKVQPIIDESGTTMETRIHVPAGYTRIPSDAKKLTGFLRGLKLKKAGSKVLLYNGRPKDDQEGQAAVFDLDVGEKNLQQCADSIIRIYAEYYWSIGVYDKIAFHLTNGFLMNYTKWRDGYRINVNGNQVSWSKTATYDDSYEQFRKYLDSVFCYAGTLSLSKECKPATWDEMLPGDLFLKGGSPGHCVLVVDIAEDKDGNRCYLLAQGYMPAQDFHILKNPMHPDDPWYYSSQMTYPLETPEWTFEEGALVRWSYFKL